MSTTTHLIQTLEKRNIRLREEDGALRYQAPEEAMTPKIIAELKTRKAEVITFLAGRKEFNPRVLPKVTASPETLHDPFPLTDVQYAYWIGRGQTYELGNIGTHIYMEIDNPDVDFSLFNRCWQRLVAHHPMLRAVILPNGRQQILPKVPEYRFAVNDLVEADGETREASIAAARSEMSHQLFKTDHWPLFEIRATHLGNTHFRFHMSFDFLICDALSISLLFHQWDQLYRAPNTELPKADISFRDYVMAEERIRESGLYTRAKTYWLARIPELPPAPDLPLAISPTRIKRPHFTRLEHTMERETWQALKAKGARHNLTPSGLLLSVFSEILKAFSRHSRFTINLTLFNRLPVHPQVDQLVGDFTSLTLLAVDLTGGRSFVEHATALQKQLWNDMDHRHFGGIEVMREMIRHHGDGARMTMPVVFTSILGFDPDETAETDVFGQTVYSISQTPQVWLDHQVTEQGGRLRFNWDVVLELFPEGFLSDMFDGYRDLLLRLAKDDTLWQTSLFDLVPARQTAMRCPEPATTFPEVPCSLHGLFTDKAALRPDHPAVITENFRLTYGELADRSDRLAACLQKEDVLPNTLVAVVMEKGWEQVVATLGVLKSGAAYLPVDPALPVSRIAYLLSDGKVRTVLTQRHLDETIAWPETIVRIVVDESLLEAEVLPIDSVHDPESLAYVIHTSGSTGNPKGVMISHGSAVNTLIDVNNRFNLVPSDRVLALSNLNFDLSVYDIFGVLAAGGTVVIPDAQRTRDPGHWLRLMTQHGITLWNSVPMFMQMLTEYAAGSGEAIPASLRLVILSGDWIPLDLPGKVHALLPRVRLIGMGGATEASIWSILYPIDTVAPHWKSIPYGRAMANQHVYVLNNDMRPCPDWVPGRLFIGGTGLAQGYWGDDEKTAASFFFHPETGERLYRTGDLGCYLPCGNIEFLGREDFQVKTRGYRVEPGEIEAALKAHPTVKESVVVTLGEKRESKSLVAYAVPASGETIRIEVLREFLENRLPKYMVPERFMILPELPLSVNGKVDRKALPLYDLPTPGQTNTFIPPRTPTETALAEIFCQILEIPQTGAGDNFFERGGDSLLAMKIFPLIRDRFQVDLPVQSIFEAPTLQGLSGLIDTYETAEGFVPLVPISPEGESAPFFCVHASDGFVFNYRKLGLSITGGHPFFGFQSRGVDGLLEPNTRIETMAREYVEALTKARPKGPYFIGGWCMGGLVAYEMAQILTSEGRKVGLLTLINSPTPDEWLEFYQATQWDLFGKMSILVQKPAKALSFVGYSPEAFKAEPESQQMELFYDGARFSDQLPPELSFEQFKNVTQVVNANLAAMCHYSPRPFYGGPVAFFQARKQPDHRIDFVDYWRKLCRSVFEVYNLPGDHFSMLLEDGNVAVLGRTLGEVLDHAENPCTSRINF